MNKIIICTYDENLVPEKKTPGSVCWDLKIPQDIEVNPGEILRQSTGVKIHMPIGRQAKVYGRSSLNKYGLMLANNTAIFDADYRGEYIMQFLNFTKEISRLERYTRTNQMEFAPYYIGSGKFGTDEIPQLEIIIDKNIYDNFAEIYPSQRGEGGIGSTGHK